MSLSPKLRDLLMKHKVYFETLQHPVAYTAQETANAEHVPGCEAVKSVIVKADGKCIMCVLPAVRLIDLAKLKRVLEVKDAQLASEEDLAKLFPDYELGAEPPFGNLYGLEVYVDKALAENNTIVFNAGTHTDSVRMGYKEFILLSQGHVVDIGKHV